MNENCKAALLYVLWHHQGSSSRVGQLVRHILGLKAAQNMNAVQIDAAHRVSAALTASHEAAPPDVEDLIRTCIPGGSICDPQQVADAIRDYFGVRDD